jgi:hypothetical protein
MTELAIVTHDPVLELAREVRRALSVAAASAAGVTVS